MKKFWNWVRDKTTGEHTLYLNVEISDETWYGDETRPSCLRTS